MVPRRPPFWKFDTVDPTSPWFPRSCMKTHEWTFATVGATVHDSFFEVLIAGSLSYLYSWLPIALFYMHLIHILLLLVNNVVGVHAVRMVDSIYCQCSAYDLVLILDDNKVFVFVFVCIAEQATSEVVDMFSRGGRDCHFANTSVEMAKFVRAAVQLLRQCFINPWIQTALFLIIAIAATSGAVSWQFAGWISLIPPRLYSIAVNKVWCLQCGQMF